MTKKKSRVLRQATADAIRAQIASGDMRPGSKVGASLRALAEQYGVGIGTMRSALALLAEEGLTETIPGKGTFVLDGPPEPVQPASTDVIEHRLEAAEMDLMELYAKLGYEQPSHQRNGRKARHEQAG